MNNTIIKTKDAEEAAFYWTMDDKFELVNIETSENYGRTIVWFCFSPKVPQNEIEKVRNDYRQGQSLVEPRKYAYRRHEIKKIIYEKQSNN